ncbi:hypothetical protein MMC30_009005 [Trapelia coarctata]|nr:hypothetical protein [Trapelia coarctata]
MAFDFGAEMPFDFNYAVPPEYWGVYDFDGFPGGPSSSDSYSSYARNMDPKLVELGEACGRFKGKECGRMHEPREFQRKCKCFACSKTERQIGKMTSKRKKKYYQKEKLHKELVLHREKEAAMERELQIKKAKEKKAGQKK